MQKFAHLAQRLFNTPIAILPSKAEVIMAALSERLGISHITVNTGPRAGFGDDWEQSEGRAPMAGFDVVNGVAVIQVEGTLVQKLGELRPYSGMTGYDGIRHNFLSALNDPDIKAIVLDIDSPGGEVAGCFDLVDTIYSARGQKPIWAILGEHAYSAAYAIASAADFITVPRTGGVGSIGVIWMHVDWSKAIQEQGVKVTFVTYGQHKADGNQYSELPKDVLARFQAEIDKMGELFVSTVARNLGVSEESIRATEALTYLGADGVGNGLAHAVLSPDAAFWALLDKLAEG